MRLPKNAETKIYRVYFINTETLEKFNLVNPTKMYFSKVAGYFWSKKINAEEYMRKALDMNINAAVEEITQEQWYNEINHRPRKTTEVVETTPAIPMQGEAELPSQGRQRDAHGRFIKKSA